MKSFHDIIVVVALSLIIFVNRSIILLVFPMDGVLQPFSCVALYSVGILYILEHIS